MLSSKELSWRDLAANLRYDCSSTNLKPLMHKYGYINIKGEFLVEPTFLKAQAFNGDYARADLAWRDASSPEYAGCSVDRSGKVAAIKNLARFSNFSEGLCQTLEKGYTGKTGFVDPLGNLLVPYIFHGANNFNSGRAIASVLSPGASGEKIWDYEFVLIDESGRELRQIGLSGTSVANWSDGLAACLPEGKDKDDRYCYVDHNGSIIVKAPKGVSYDFSEGLASFTERKNDNYAAGFFDKSGKIVIAPQFSFAGSFSEGLAAVQQDDRWFYINKEGQRVISLPGDCSKARPFSHGLAAVQLGGEKKEDEFGDLTINGGNWGYIDHSGKLVIQAEFSGAYTNGEFGDEGLASVSSLIDGELRYGYIDRSGKYIIQAIYREATHFSSGIAAVQVASVGFIQEDWQDWQNTEEYPSRADALSEFFKSYPVTGMSRTQIHSLLGTGFKKDCPDQQGNVESYSLTSSWCGHGCRSFDLLYQDEQVVGWRTSTIDHEPPFSQDAKLST